MIKNKIKSKFVHQFNILRSYNDDVFIADYTEQSKNSNTKRGVEIFSTNAPTDIDFFEIFNERKIEIEGLAFDKSSFVRVCGGTKSQCEAMFFPKHSDDNSWVLFCELKYSEKPRNNRGNLQKAIKQLYRTRYYYVQENAISSSNICYLIASLPMQIEPFVNFILPTVFTTKLKKEKNIILRLKNSVELENDKIINI